MAPSKTNAVSLRRVFCMFLALLAIGSIARCAPTDVEILNHPTIIDGNILPALHSWNSRTPGVRQPWFNVVFPGVGVRNTEAVWASDKIPCSVKEEDEVKAFADSLARDAYDSMLMDTPRTDNLVACLCIPEKCCFCGTIPNRDDAAIKFVLQIMLRNTEWKDAWGSPNEGSFFHAEDMAIARAAQYSYKIPFDKRPYIAVHGLYNLLGAAPNTDNVAGPAGVRWACVSSSKAKGRDFPCSAVLTKVNIDFDYKP